MKYGELKRGFKPLRKQMRDKGKYCADCRSCRHFYAEEGDKEDVCHSSSVTKFDMVYETNRTYCIFWEPEGDK